MDESFLNFVLDEEVDFIRFESKNVCVVTYNDKTNLVIKLKDSVWAVVGSI